MVQSVHPESLSFKESVQCITAAAAPAWAGQLLREQPQQACACLFESGFLYDCQGPARRADIWCYPKHVGQHQHEEVQRVQPLTVSKPCLYSIQQHQIVLAPLGPTPGPCPCSSRTARHRCEVQA